MHVGRRCLLLLNHHANSRDIAFGNNIWHVTRRSGHFDIELLHLDGGKPEHMWRSLTATTWIWPEKSGSSRECVDGKSLLRHRSCLLALPLASSYVGTTCS